ncbi:hypothetical protein BDQ17DRAFT_1433017 [Cyathus striatus]|nr:hypothetical protein BDQ17DRAFT_1433017 [Cyathus striatus]
MSANSDVYLFISDPKVDEVTGEVSLPDVYWSLDNSGVQTLSEFSAISKGLHITNLSMVPYVSYWDKYYYEAMPDIYITCGVTLSDVCNLLGLSELKLRQPVKLSQSSLYMEDLDVSYLTIKEKKKRLIPVEEAAIPDKHYSERDIVSLSWIGITNLEDCIRIKGTMYSTIVAQRNFIKVFLDNMRKNVESAITGEIRPVDVDEDYIDIL